MDQTYQDMVDFIQSCIDEHKIGETEIEAIEYALGAYTRKEISWQVLVEKFKAFRKQVLSCGMDRAAHWSCPPYGGDSVLERAYLKEYYK